MPPRLTFLGTHPHPQGTKPLLTLTLSLAAGSHVRCLAVKAEG